MGWQVSLPSLSLLTRPEIRITLFKIKQSINQPKYCIITVYTGTISYHIKSDVCIAEACELAGRVGRATGLPPLPSVKKDDKIN